MSIYNRPNITVLFLGFLGLLYFISGCFCQYFPRSAIPRSVSGFGSKRMLDSFAIIEADQPQLTIIEYNEDDLSVKNHTTPATKYVLVGREGLRSVLFGYFHDFIEYRCHVIFLHFARQHNGSDPERHSF